LRFQADPPQLTHLSPPSLFGFLFFFGFPPPQFFSWENVSLFRPRSPGLFFGVLKTSPPPISLLAFCFVTSSGHPFVLGRQHPPLLSPSHCVLWGRFLALCVPPFIPSFSGLRILSVVHTLKTHLLFLFTCPPPPLTWRPFHSLSRLFPFILRDLFLIVAA